MKAYRGSRHVAGREDLRGVGPAVSIDGDVATPLPPERNDDQHLDLPRISFRMDKFHFGGCGLRCNLPPCEPASSTN
jgi:hypothetical protein